METDKKIKMVEYVDVLNRFLLLKKRIMEKYNFDPVENHSQETFDALKREVHRQQTALGLKKEEIVEIETKINEKLGIKKIPNSWKFGRRKED